MHSIINDVTVLIVLYNPDKELLFSNLQKLLCQSNHIILIDNTPGGSSIINKNEASKFGNSITYLPLYKNLGVAEAQNKGIMICKEKGSTFLLFMDQDSSPSEDMIKYLREGYLKLTNMGIKVGGVGARTIDRESGKKYVALLDKGKKNSAKYTQLNQLISSGTLVNTQVFNDVGLMESELFIDAVDFEWCWRAGRRKYRFFIAEEAFIEHKFGLSEHHFGKIKVSIPSPFRCYYLYRNYILLVFRSYVPLYWKISNLVKFIFKFLYYPIFLKNRRDYFKYTIKGVKDGIKGILKITRN